MTRVDTAYIRRGAVVFMAPTRTLFKDFKSINKAKRFSREEQQKHGGLGAGYVRVEKP